MRKHLALALTLISGAWGQVASEANRSYESAEDRARMIDLLSSPNRAERLKAEKLVAELGLSPGDTVVDLGTGAGFLLPYLSRAVGEDGKVIAQDIHEDFTKAARQTAEEAGLGNVSYVIGGVRNPGLQAGAADVIVTVDAYHHFDYPEEMLSGIRSALADGGRFVLVDYYKDGFRDPDHIRADKPEVIREVEAAGFRLVRGLEHVPDTQYMLILEVR